jgi:hypothetical protein
MQPPVADEHVFLIGRPPLGEFLSFVAANTVDGEAADPRLLADEWRKANDHIRELEKREVGWADNPTIAPLPKRLEPLMTQVLADPMFQRGFNIVPVDIGTVELDRLVVFQKQINLDFVRQLRATLGDSPSDEQVFRFCLPFDHPNPPAQVGRIAPNAYQFSSKSTDLRFLEPALLRSQQITGYAPQGPIVGVVALMVGYGSNYLNAVHVENRLVLNNGSHRAFALREAGIKQVPCIVQHVSRREELELVLPNLHQRPELYLTPPRPPVLKDYFDEKLRKLVRVPRRLRHVRITFGVEQLDLPAT